MKRLYKVKASFFGGLRIRNVHSKLQYLKICTEDKDGANKN